MQNREPLENGRGGEMSEKKLTWHWDQSRNCFYEGALADRRWALPENIIKVIDAEVVSPLRAALSEAQAKIESEDESIRALGRSLDAMRERAIAAEMALSEAQARAEKAENSLEIYQATESALPKSHAAIVEMRERAVKAEYELAKLKAENERLRQSLENADQALAREESAHAGRYWKRAYDDAQEQNRVLREALDRVIAHSQGYNIDGTKRGFSKEGVEMCPYNWERVIAMAQAALATPDPESK